MIKGHKTSKDYKRLKELLGGGKKIVIALPEIVLGRREAYLASKTEDPVSHRDCYDFGLGFWLEDGPVSIEKRLERLGIEFIEPTEE